MNLQNILSLIVLVVAAGHTAVAQEPAKQPVAAEKTSESLRDDQLAISGRYARFERMLSQMADILGRQDPERADLLRRAIGKGREDRISEDIEKIVELLNKRELGGASEQQAEVIESLQVLLKLLQSEDRRSSMERERERLNGLLKDVRSVIAEQRSARAATQNSDAPSSAAPGQQKALTDTDKLLEAMQNHDDKDTQEGKDGESSGDPKDSEASESEPGDREQDKKDDQSPGDKSKKSGEPSKAGPKGTQLEPKDGNPSGPKTPQNDSSPPHGQPSKDGQKGTGKKSAGKKGTGQKSSGQQSDKKQSEQTPGREQLEEARQLMEEALEALKQQERENALTNEDRAIKELHEAAAKLEEMLKQLREEEKEIMLATLEARFQRMLIAETQIHEGTLSLAETPQKDWLDQYYSRCRELAQQQSELTQECAQTVNLLREDGSSVSILLAVEDIEADMSSATGWLQESKVGELTQSIQTDILESLRQLIEAMQQEMQEMKEKHDEQEQQEQQNSQDKPSLVKQMAEIRMLRTLQLQVNRRTKQLDNLMQSAETDDKPAVRSQLQSLAERQQRLIHTARELAKQDK